MEEMLTDREFKKVITEEEHLLAIVQTLTHNICELKRRIEKLEDDIKKFTPKEATR